MVPANTDLRDMIRRPTPMLETGTTRDPEDEMNVAHTYVATVEDRPGALNRVVSLFRRRGFNIASLTVGTPSTRACRASRWW